MTSEPVALDWDFKTESLQVNDCGEDDNSGDEVHDVGETVSPEGLTKSTSFIIPREEEMEESDDSTFKLWTATGIDGSRRECLPDDGLANVGSDEKGNSGSQTITFLEELIKKNDDEGGRDELDNEEKTDTSAEILWLTVKPSKDVDDCLTEGNDEREY